MQKLFVTTVRVRLAPSPTGSLHIGTARTALFNWLFAKNLGGKFLIRIEDTDKERSKSEFKANILEGLTWLGLIWDEKPVIQSQLIQNHQAAIQLLLDKGLAYRCYANEEELEEMKEDQRANGLPPKHDNRHRNLTKSDKEAFIREGRTSVIRFRIEDHKSIIWNDLIRGPIKWNTDDLGGDMVISRRAPAQEIGAPLYNLAVVVDDSSMNITHVIRGEDHIANTAKQILLYEALGLKIPQFAHTPLILNEEGKKLSKRDGVTSISDFKEMGYTSQAMTNYMTLLGWSPPEGMEEIFTIQEASSVFDFDRVNKAGAKFDWNKLKWINSQSIHNLPKEILFKELLPLWNAENWQCPNTNWGIDLTELLRPSMILIKDGVDQAKPYFEEPTIKQDGKNQLSQDSAKKVLGVLLKSLDEQPWDGINLDRAQDLIKSSSSELNLKKGILMKSLRVALLGELQGPDLITTWSLLARFGVDRDRIRRCI